MSVVSGIVGAISSENAAETQAQAAESGSAATLQLGREAIAAQTAATDKAIAAEREMFDISRADTAPWRTAGANALTTLQDKIKSGPPKAPGEFKYEESPAFKVSTERALNALDRRNSAMGKVNSGAAQKGIVDWVYGTAAADYRTEEDRFWDKYDKELNRYYQEMQPNFTMAGLGSSGANLSANLATTTGGQMGNAYTSGGNTQAGILTNTAQGVASNALYAGTARASGYINQANALKGASNTALEGYSLYRGLNSGSNAWSSAAKTYGAGSEVEWFS